MKHHCTHQQHVVLVGLDTHVLVKASLPQPLHVVPVLDEAVSNGVVCLKHLRRHSVIADEVLHVADALLAAGAPGAGICSTLICCSYRRRNKKARLSVATVPHFCVTGAGRGGKGKRGRGGLRVKCVGEGGSPRAIVYDNGLLVRAHSDPQAGSTTRRDEM